MDVIDPDPSGNRRARARGDRMKRSAVLAAAALGAGGASLGVAAIADAGSSSSKTSTTRTAVRHGWFFGARPGTLGTVKSVGSGSFTITTPENTTVTVDVTSATKYEDPSKSSASLADVTVGEHVAVAGTGTSNTVAATDVFIGGPGGWTGGPGGWTGGPGGPGGFRGPGGWTG
jgi:Domain of unknown function (DUF5666)